MSRVRLNKKLATIVTWLTAALAGVWAPSGADEGEPQPQPLDHEFYFSRVIYGAPSEEDFGPRWAVDYPKADQQFLVALKRLSGVDAFASEHALRLNLERLHEFPFLYVLEVGSLSLKEEERDTLRHYLLSGGFLVVDDFWGSWEWDNFENEMRELFPDRPLVEVPLDHPVFHAFYDIGEIVQVPNVYQGTTGGVTHEYDGYVPRARGIFDDDGRLMVLVNWNTDLGDGWEWADHPQYPLRFSTYAYEMGINFVIYAMTY
ncbi:MAG: DUF4159 domain-containing protein [Pseudomonadota bacterium]